MKEAKGDGVVPVHWEDFQQGMDIPPVFDGHEHTVVVFALVEGPYIVEIKIRNMDLGMVFPQVVPEEVYIVAPVPAHEHQVFPIQILDGQLVLLGQMVMDGHGTADRLPGNFQPRALRQCAVPGSLKFPGRSPECCQRAPVGI